MIHLATEYANLCHRVIAPSESIRELLVQRGVTTPISVLPTGVDRGRFAVGDGTRFRRRQEISDSAFVIGHVGRLAAEKNLGYLGRAVAAAVAASDDAHFLVAGEGPAHVEIEEAFADRGCSERLHLIGNQEDQDLVDAYHAMDVFAFASRSETQGMVLAEALTVGIPVVALAASGTREVVEDGTNGRLLDPEADAESFAKALREVRGWIEADPEAMHAAAFASSDRFSTIHCLEELEEIYRTMLAEKAADIDLEGSQRSDLLRTLEREWELWSARFEAVAEAVSGRDEGED